MESWGKPLLSLEEKMTFDPEKAHGHQYRNETGIRFVQGGKYYTNNFVEVDIEGKLVEVEPKAKLADLAKAEKKVKKVAKKKTVKK
jgi:hypothetical protein